MTSDIGVWLRTSPDHPAGRTTGTQLLDRWWGIGGQIGEARARELAAAMDAVGFCFEPDIRFSGHVLRPADTVIFYPCGERPGAPTEAYLAAATIARLGVIVASADGVVVPEEQAVIRARTSKAIDLTPGEDRRLETYVGWLLDTPVALDASDREGTGLPEADRIRIGRFLVAVAGADGYISTPERWMLDGAFRLFGLTAEHLDAEIASLASAQQSDPVQADTTHLSMSVVKDVLHGSDKAIVELGGLLPIAPVSAVVRVREYDAIDALFGETPLPEMEEWEARFASHWAGLTPAERRRAGSLLALVPPRDRWEDFVAAWKKWPIAYWMGHTVEVPHALAVLFGGFAFFEYDETSFWPQFTRDLWPLTEPERGALRTAHAAALEQIGLDLVRNQSADRMTVASAVQHIGVPLSLWADFLGIADHVLRQPDWRAWTSEHWAADVATRCGPLVRLAHFLTANEIAARETISELSDIRDYAQDDPGTTIEDLANVANVPFLRDEYFDDVPETAEFFRPDNLISLFAGRYFLHYDVEESRLQLHLPGVPEPAGRMWRVGGHERPAVRDPSWFTIDADGFARWIDVRLEGPGPPRSKRIAGISAWGLYDQHREAFLDLDLRHPSELRMGDYVLVSPHPLTHLTRKGFSAEFPENQVVRLADGTRCYVTRLSPASVPEGSLTVRWADGVDLRSHVISFKTRLTTRPRTMLINGLERPVPDPSLPFYFLRPGPYPPIRYAALPNLELTKMNNQGSATAYARLKRYMQEGVIVARKDGAWMLDHERARVRRVGDTVEVRLLGRPSNMWSLGREQEPVTLEIIGEEGLTYLRATWPADYERAILDRLKRYSIDVIRE